MTAAERMREYRARKREPEAQDPWLAFYGNREQFARKLQMSLRKSMYMHAWAKATLIKWDREILRGEYGKIGFQFLADVCQHADAATQQYVHDLIKEQGATAARQIWRAAKADQMAEQDDDGK